MPSRSAGSVRTFTSLNGDAEPRRGSAPDLRREAALGEAARALHEQDDVGRAHRARRFGRGSSREAHFGGSIVRRRARHRPSDFSGGLLAMFKPAATSRFEHVQMGAPCRAVVAVPHPRLHRLRRHWKASRSPSGSRGRSRRTAPSSSRASSPTSRAWGGGEPAARRRLLSRELRLRVPHHEGERVGDDDRGVRGARVEARLLLLSLGAMHFANMYVFHRIRRRARVAAMPPPVLPQMYVAPRAAPPQTVGEAMAAT